MDNKRRGAVSIEYGLLLALVIVLALSGIQYLGSSASSSVSKLGNDWAQTNETPPASAKPKSAEIESSAPFRLPAWLPHAACLVLAIGVLISRVRRERRERCTDANSSGEDAEPVITTRLEAMSGKRQQILRALSGNTQALFGNQLQVRHLMTFRTVTAESSQQVSAIRDLMNEHHVRHVIVSGADQRIRGVVSDRDLSKDDGRKVADIMTGNPVTVKASTPLDSALSLMQQNRVSCLPVVDENERAVGVMTVTDVFMGFQCVLQLMQQIESERQSESPELELECTLRMLRHISGADEEHTSHTGV